MRFTPALACVALAATTAPAGPPCSPDPGMCGAVMGGLAFASAQGSAVGASWSHPTAPDVGSGLHAQPPSQATLDRLRLAQEWYAHVPLQGAKDGLALVQVIDEELVIAQTRSGLVVALDARTGAKQWSYRLPAAYAVTYPVATAGRFVFVANLATLVCLQRLTGQVEFVQRLTGSVTTGPAAAIVPVYGLRDNQKAVIGQRVAVYVTLNGNRLVSFPVPDAGRVALSILPPPPPAPVYTRPSMQPASALISTDAGRNPTPSISALPVIIPPYSLASRQTRLTPSLTVLPTMYDQTTRNPEFLRHNQRTPSIGILPPSVARAFELSNLRATAPTLSPTWVWGSNRRLGYEPVLSPAVSGVAGARAFAPTTSDRVSAVNAEDGRELFHFNLEANLAGPPAGPAAVNSQCLGLFPLDDGVVVAVDLLRGTQDAPVIAWRSVIGGVLNRAPVVTANAVYAAGDGAGVAKLDLHTGDLMWRTDTLVDRVLAVSEEFVFARDRVGNTLVYAKAAVPGPSGRIAPVAALPADGYTVPVTNSRTDRLFLAAENGLVVSLRDALPRAVRPSSIAPPTTPTPPNPNPPVVNPDTPPPSGPEPKSDAPPAAPAPPPAAPKKDAPMPPMKG